MAVAAEWLHSTGNADRGLTTVDHRNTLGHYGSLRPFRKLPRLTSRNVGFMAGYGGDGPILALDPSRELLLKLTDSHLLRATEVLLVDFHPGVALTDRWLCATGAIELATRRKYVSDEKQKLDPVVLAAFEELRDSHVGQLCTPEHSYDPNGVTALRKLKEHNHKLDEDALAVWAVFNGIAGLENSPRGLSRASPTMHINESRWEAGNRATRDGSSAALPAQTHQCDGDRLPASASRSRERCRASSGTVRGLPPGRMVDHGRLDVRRPRIKPSAQPTRQC